MCESVIKKSCKLIFCPGNQILRYADNPSINILDVAHLISQHITVILTINPCDKQHRYMIHITCKK